MVVRRTRSFHLFRCVCNSIDDALSITRVVEFDRENNLIRRTPPPMTRCVHSHTCIARGFGYYYLSSITYIYTYARERWLTDQSWSYILVRFEPLSGSGWNSDIAIMMYASVRKGFLEIPPSKGLNRDVKFVRNTWLYGSKYNKIISIIIIIQHNKYNDNSIIFHNWTLLIPGKIVRGRNRV